MIPSRKAIVFSLCSLCLCGPILSSALAGPPRDDLLKLVPDDVGFCLMLQDLRGHFEQLQSSPFAVRFLASPVGQVLRTAPEWKRIAAVEKQLKTNLDVDWAKLLDILAGDAVVLAYKPGPPDQPEQEQGLLLAWSRHPDQAGPLIGRLNDMQIESGELSTVEQKLHQGRKYFRREKANKRDNEFIFVSGPVVAFSAQEAMIKKAIERDIEASQSSTIGKQFKQLGVDNCLFVWWINPRAFDSAINGKANGEAGPAATVLQTFKTYWSALDSAALFFDVKDDAHLGIAIKARPADLPAAGRQFFGEAAKPSSIITGFPDDALFAITGRFAPAPLIMAARDFLTVENQKAIHDLVERALGAVLGKDALAAVPRQFGPDWGICVLPPSAKGWLPMLVGVLRFHAEAGDPVLEQRVNNALNFAAMLAVVNYNTRHADQIALKSEKQGDIEVRYLANDQGFLPGLQPAFGFKEGYLVVASSPDAVKRFNPPKGDAILTGNEFPLVRFSACGWAAYVKAHREPLTTFLAESQQINRAEVTKGLDNLLGVLELFERIDLIQRTVPGQVTLTLKLKPATAMKK